VAVFRFAYGCYCDPAQRQPLCLHHAIKSGAARGPNGEPGTMELIEDLTIGDQFTQFWTT
jgi:hypothetical protein